MINILEKRLKEQARRMCCRGDEMTMIEFYKLASLDIDNLCIYHSTVQSFFTLKKEKK